MDQPVNAEEVNFGNHFRQIEGPIPRPCLVGDVFEFPVNVESADNDTMPDVSLDMWLQRYFPRDVAAAELGLEDKRVNNKEVGINKVILGTKNTNTYAIKTSKTRPETTDEFYGAEGYSQKDLARSSENLTRLPADHLDKRPRQILEKSKKAPIGSKSLVQMVDNCPQNLPIKRGRGRPRKQKYPTPSIFSEHNHAAKEKMSATVINSTIQTRQSLNTYISNHVRGVLMHPATNPLPKYYPHGSRFSQRLATKHSVALETTSDYITPVEKAQPESHGDHLPKMSRKNMNADEVMPGVTDMSNQLGVDVPCAKLCRTCYDEVATLVGRELNTNTIPLRVVSRKPAERTGIGKRGRGRPREMKESHWAAFKRKKSIAGL